MPDSRSDNVLEASDVSKSYGLFSKNVALNRVSLVVQKGTCVSLVGRNGAGKTTFLKVISNLVNTFQGKISKQGSIAYMPETNGIYPFNTSQEVLEFFSKFGNSAFTVNGILEKLNLLVDDNRPLNSYSKGMKRKVTFGSIMALYPDLFVLDEPFEGLDPDTCRDIVEVINDLKKNGRSFIISSHDLYYLKEVSDRVLVIDKGKIIRELDPEAESVCVIKFTSNIEMVKFVLDKLKLNYKIDNFPLVEITYRENIDAILAEIINGGLRFNESRSKDLFEYFREILNE
ncbi:MAG: ATP-binding cassette domain-containing protein [Thermoplasmataceae archaeon]